MEPLDHLTAEITEFAGLNPATCNPPGVMRRSPRPALALPHSLTPGAGGRRPLSRSVLLDLSGLSFFFQGVPRPNGAPCIERTEQQDDRRGYTGKDESRERGQNG